MLSYKEYRAKAEFDRSAGVFHGRVINTRDVIFFEGTSVDELTEEFRFSVDDYLAMCAQRGEDPTCPAHAQRASPVDL